MWKWGISGLHGVGLSDDRRVVLLITLGELQEHVFSGEKFTCEPYANQHFADPMQIDVAWISNGGRRWAHMASGGSRLGNKLIVAERA
jgi:hypothetical protein